MHEMPKNMNKYLNVSIRLEVKLRRVAFFSLAIVDEMISSDS